MEIWKEELTWKLLPLQWHRPWLMSFPEARMERIERGERDPELEKEREEMVKFNLAAWLCLREGCRARYRVN
jgi:hypothetical protein